MMPIDASTVLGVVAAGLAGLAALQILRYRRLTVAARTWGLIALIFVLVRLWLGG